MLEEKEIKEKEIGMTKGPLGAKMWSLYNKHVSTKFVFWHLFCSLVSLYYFATNVSMWSSVSNFRLYVSFLLLYLKTIWSSEFLLFQFTLRVVWASPRPKPKDLLLSCVMNESNCFPSFLFLCFKTSRNLDFKNNCNYCYFLVSSVSSNSNEI